MASKYFNIDPDEIFLDSTNLPDFDNQNVYFRLMVGLRRGNVIDVLSWLAKKGI